MGGTVNRRVQLRVCLADVARDKGRPVRKALGRTPKQVPDRVLTSRSHEPVHPVLVLDRGHSHLTVKTLHKALHVNNDGTYG